MIQRIILVRHGPSAHVHDAGMIDRAGVQSSRDARDLVGITVIAQPPPGLLRMAANATHVIASDLRRAVASAERLAPGRPILVSPLLREIPLPIPRWPSRLPMWLWELLIHLRWGYQIVRGLDAQDVDLARATAAAEWLAEVVGGRSTAVVVTHGVFRRLLARRLLVLGWTDIGRHGGYRHWSAWSFAGPPETADPAS
jgi:broad specificity phosphatase PhoE